MTHESTRFDPRPPGALGNRVARLGPKSSSAMSSFGWPLTLHGTITTPSFDDDPASAQLARTRLAATNAVVGFHSPRKLCWLGNAPRLGGFCLTVRFLLPTVPEGTRAFIGLSSATDAFVGDGLELAIPPNSIGIGFDGSSGTVTAFSAITKGPEDQVSSLIADAPPAEQLYDLAIYGCANGGAYRMRLTDLTTGNIVLSDKEYLLSATVPLESAFLAVHAEVWNGESAIALEIIDALLEVPDASTYVLPLGHDGVFPLTDFLGGSETRHDAGFERALAAMHPSNETEYFGSTLWVPPGTWGIANDLRIIRLAKLQGAAPGATTLALDPRATIVTHGIYGAVGSAQDSVLIDLDVVASKGDVGVWEADRDDWEVGDVILTSMSASERPGASWVFSYEVVHGTDSDVAEPSLVPAVIPDASELWTKEHPYFAGDVVRSASRWDILLRCLVGGESDPLAEPSWGNTVGAIVPDGPENLQWLVLSAESTFTVDHADDPDAVVWATRTFPGIYALTITHLERVRVASALNAAVHYQGRNNSASGQPTEALNTVVDGSTCYELWMAECGAGIVNWGNDANTSRFINVQFRGRQYDTSDDRNVGYIDQGLLGNHFLGATVAYCGGLSSTSFEANGAITLGLLASDGAGAGQRNGGGVIGASSGYVPLEGNQLMSYGALGAHWWSRLSSSALSASSVLLSSEMGQGKTLYIARSDADAYEIGTDYQFGWWCVSRGGVGALGTVVQLAGANAILSQDPDPPVEPPGSVLLTQYFGMGYAGSESGRAGRRRFLILDGPPPTIATPDRFRTGDIWFNASPGSLAPSFWVLMDDSDPDELRWEVGFWLL